MTNNADPILRQGYRVIRRLAGGGEAPWPGDLVCGPDGEMAVAVDSALLGTDWGGWDAADSDHILGPLDLLRRSDGHDVLIPVCTERLEEFLVRRGADGADLSIGEGVTVAVSLLRGLAEREGARGAWWLTEAGRPVFATETDESSLEDATVTLLELLGRGLPELDAAVAEVIQNIADPRRLRRSRARAEASLFEAAAPLALATTTFGPKRVRGILPPAQDALDPDAGSPRTPWPFSLMRHVDADWSDLISRTTTGVWRRLRSRQGRGKKPWLVATGVAGAILVLGLLWPSGPGGPATADVASSPSEAVPHPSPGVAADPPATDPPPAELPPTGAVPNEEPPVAAGDLASIAAALLTSRTECAADVACVASVVESGEGRFPTGVIDLPAAQRSVTLLDEFGGAAVLRAEAVGLAGTPQLVIIVRVGDRWLLRDIHDIAQQ